MTQRRWMKSAPCWARCVRPGSKSAASRIPPKHRCRRPLMPASDALLRWQAFSALAEDALRAAEREDWALAISLGGRLAAQQQDLPAVDTLELDDAQHATLRLTLLAIQANIEQSRALMGRERDTLSEEMHHLRTSSRVLDAYSKGA
ncbi:flagellar protein FliT [Aquitalea sp. S1-19]|nr:flagellar protein FliT [Aquitalea sp. S1-19]